jgi:hypothetical protein
MGGGLIGNMQEWMRWEPTRNRRRLSSLVLEPARVTVGIGAAMAVVGGLMPWAQGTVPGRLGFEPAFFSGLGGAGDGVLLVILAATIAFLVLHHTPVDSRIRLVHVIPYVLIGLAAITCLNGYRAAMLEIAAWERRGGSGEIAPGLWLAAGGVAVMAIGAAALLPRLVRWTRAGDDPADLMTVSARGIAEVVAGLVGVLLGGAIGIQVAVSLTPVPVIGLIALGAVFGALLGAYAGSWASGQVADVIERRRGRPGGA